MSAIYLHVLFQKIYAADINSVDGSLGVWNDIGNLPVPLSGFGLFIQDDHIIIAGGENANGKSNKTYTTTFQADGTINIWTETSNLPVALTRAQFTKYNSTIFTIGGIKSDGSASDQVYFTQIKSDGTLEPWQTSLNTLPQPTCCGSALLSNNFIYLIGGHNTFTGEYYDDVFYTSPDEIIGSGNIQILNVPCLLYTSNT